LKVPRSGKVAPPTAGMPSRHSGQISKSRIFELADVSGRSERPSSEPVVLPLSLRHRMPVDLVGSGPESLLCLVLSVCVGARDGFIVSRRMCHTASMISSSSYVSNCSHWHHAGRICLA